MKLFKLVIKNVFRHKLRTFLTVVGMGVAVVAFGLMRTVVTAWNSGVEASSTSRLVTRDAVTIVNPLPLSYYQQIKQVPGVERVTWENWFGGIYINRSNFFARLAVDTKAFFKIYPEYVLPKKEMKNFLGQQNSCVVGEVLAKRYHFKIGGLLTLKGDIYPGTWDFVIAGIYKPKFKTTDATQMFFHWTYLNETIRQEMPARANQVGWYIEKINSSLNPAKVGSEIDALFNNSSAETKTETERAFAKGFLSSSSAIITGINMMSFIIIGIILLVLANTMIMSARERTREYAVLKAIGFSGRHLIALIMGESLLISFMGGIVGVLLTYPLVNSFANYVPRGAFPVFDVEPVTLMFAFGAVITVGIAASIFPIQRAISTKIAEGVRFAG